MWLVILGILLVGIAFGVFLRSGIDWYGGRGNDLAKKRMDELGMGEEDKHEDS